MKTTKQKITYHQNTAIQKAINSGKGNITFVFVSERYNTKTGKNYTKKAFQTVRLREEAFLVEEKNGIRKATPKELIKKFDAMRHDLGAKYFLIG